MHASCQHKLIGSLSVVLGFVLIEPPPSRRTTTWGEQWSQRHLNWVKITQFSSNPRAVIEPAIFVPHQVTLYNTRTHTVDFEYISRVAVTRELLHSSYLFLHPRRSAKSFKRGIRSDSQRLTRPWCDGRIGPRMPR